MLILKDNSLLQVQMRDLKGFVETRRLILVEKPQNRGHWLAFAVAHHLAGNLSTAIEVLDQFSQTISSTRAKDYEESELVLYRNSLVESMGDFKGALEHLDANTDWVVDQV
jgi:peptide alpha-N-acetyltransferase